MNLFDEIKADREKKEYWEKIVGKELLDDLLLGGSKKECFEETAKSIHDNPANLEAFLSHIPEKREKNETDWLFAPFYQKVQSYILHRICALLFDSNRFGLSYSVIEKLADTYTEGMQSFIFRCILQEMYNLKQTGRLEGKNTEEEYQYFLKEYLAKEAYQRYLCKKYQVMTALILEKTVALEEFLKEVLGRLEKDKQKIEQNICGGSEFKQILDVRLGMSDEHYPGKTAVRLELDNGRSIYYKPRSLKSELEYQKLYSWLLEQCSMEAHRYGILDFGKYGWMEEVLYKPCETKHEIHRYYRRMGLHLFLAYVFSISDLHFENIVSSGEYPILIDLETFPGRGIEPESQTKMEGIWQLLQDSVLSTGILPGQQWGNEKVNMGALGSPEKQKSPFQISKIEKQKTSEMHITYDFIEMDCSQSVPEYQGSKVEVGMYTEELMKGFCVAYEKVMDYTEIFTAAIQEAFLCKGRYVLRHSQQYEMYMKSAAFPELMEDSQKRALLLCRMSKDVWCRSEYKDEIAAYEIMATMHELIPIYYHFGSDLITGAGTVFKDYFQNTVQEQVRQRVDHLSKKDLHRQLKWIGLSMWVSYPRKKGMHSTYEKNPKGLITSREIMERLLFDMEKLDGNYEWIGVHYTESSWYFDKVGMYLYDGLCGISIFVTAMVKAGNERYKKISTALCERLFRYTQAAWKDREKLQSRHTGIFEGESSLVYTYLVLYKITRKEEFLTYAKKHSRIVGELLEEDQEYDLLYGNAGAAVAMAQMYTVTRDKWYRKKAQWAADFLLAHRTAYKVGNGWITPNQQFALAGMAHGNSGIALALACVWEVTKKEAYYSATQQALSYENTLYQEETGNWADLRGWKTKGELPETDMVAWCHGAGGILMARSRISEIFGKDNEKVDYKIPQAFGRVLNAQDNNCGLCHGKAGYAEAVNYYNKVTGEQQGIRSYHKWLEFKGWSSIPVDERFQSGFMNGLAGIGYALLREEKENLPNLLVLE